MPDIFISYSHEDQEIARRFAAAFEARGFDVWWDSAMQAGEAFDQVIETTLKLSKAVVVLWSPRSAASRWVRAEAVLADRLGKLAPATIEPCERPIMFELTHTADLSHWDGSPEDPAWRVFLSGVERMVRGAADAPLKPEQAPAEVAPSARASRPHGRRLLLAGAALAGLLALGGGAWMAWRLLPAAPSRPVRIAVAPFAAEAAAPQLQGFADRLSDQVLGALSTRQIPTVSGPDAAALGAPGGDRAARRMGVALLIRASVRRDGSDAVVDLHFEQPASQATVWSAEFQGPASEGGELPGQVAAKTAAMLDCGARALRPAGGLTDAGPLSSYLNACDLFQKSGGQFDADASFQLFTALRRVIATAPRFAPARSDLAKYEAYFTHYGVFGADQASSLRREARAEADRALALDPKDADAYVALMFLVERPGWAERERLLRRALAVDPDWPHANGFLGFLLTEVGRLKEAAAYTQRASAANPLSPDLGWTAQSAQALSNIGRTDLADGVLAQLRRSWPHDQDVWNARLKVALDAGRWDEAVAVVQDPGGRPSYFTPSDVADDVMLLRAARSHAPDQRAAARRMVLDRVRRTPVLANQAIGQLSILGFTDDAFELASSPAARSFADGPYATLFEPPTAPMRRDPRFMTLAARLGLVDYWRATGKWPDFCADPALPYDCKAEAAKAVRRGPAPG